ncbi:MAG: LPXTG cell wall anchor domain-containing protein, partial [Nitriliruptoraceae bacterium]
TGDTPLLDVTLTDDVIGDLTDELSVTVLPVGASTVVEVAYTTTAAQLDAGQVVNVATTTGTTIEGATVEDEDDETVFLVEVLEVVEELPKTGFDAVLLTAAGLAMSLLGAAAVWLADRRRKGLLA